MLLYEVITRPKGVQRSPDDQKEIDLRTENLVLYQYKTCPFCLKVRHAISKLSLNIRFCDAQFDSKCKQGLLENGGKVQVPCLKVVGENGEETWLYESNRIIQYLNKQYAE